MGRIPKQISKPTPGSRKIPPFRVSLFCVLDIENTETRSISIENGKWVEEDYSNE
jgi:hypothetical protein